VTPEPAPVAPEPAEETPAQVENDEKVAEEIPVQVRKARNDKMRKWLRILLIVLGVVVVLLLLFALLSRIAPGLLDPLLYSKEDLQILRY
jgi:hypothetical protein